MQETKCNSNFLITILSKAWPSSLSMAVDVIGASGGLAIACNAQAIALIDFHANHHFIQANFHIIGTNVHSHLTNVYFPQVVVDKTTTLDTLTLLNATRTHPL